MFVGALEFDILLGDVRSLKEKRSLVKPLVAELVKFGVAAVEAGDQNLHRRALIGVAYVSADAGHLANVLDRCERQVAGHPELQLLAVRRRVFGPHDEFTPAEAGSEAE